MGGVYFAYMGRRNPLMDWARFFLGERYLWRNHACQIWWRSLKGFRSSCGSNFSISHWLCWSSLQHSHTTMWACDWCNFCIPTDVSVQRMRDFCACVYLSLCQSTACAPMCSVYVVPVSRQFTGSTSATSIDDADCPVTFSLTLVHQRHFLCNGRRNRRDIVLYTHTHTHALFVLFANEAHLSLIFIFSILMLCHWQSAHTFTVTAPSHVRSSFPCVLRCKRGRLLLETPSEWHMDTSDIFDIWIDSSIRIMDRTRNCDVKLETSH